MEYLCSYLITIQARHPEWPILFAKENTRLLSVAGAYIDDIQHMGSTSGHREYKV